MCPFAPHILAKRPMIVAKPRFRYIPDKGFYAVWEWYTAYNRKTPVVVGPYASLDAAWAGRRAAT